MEAVANLLELIVELIMSSNTKGTDILQNLRAVKWRRKRNSVLSCISGMQALSYRYLDSSGKRARQALRNGLTGCGFSLRK